jgi:hypothetical protein
MARWVHCGPRSVATSSLIALIGLLALLLAFLLRGRSPQPQHLHLTPQNAIVLEHMCKATGAILRSGVPPLSVTLDLSYVPMLGDSTLGPLEYACAKWATAGTRVTLTGCQPEVAGALWRRSVRAHVELGASAPASTTLH